MKVSIGHFFGKCLWLFLFFYICLNGHVVNGQTVGIENVTFVVDLSAFNLTTCFSTDETASGVLDVSTDPHILTQSASEVPIFVTANLMCQSHVILIAIVSEQLGTEVTVKIAASSTTDNPVSVDESQSSFKVTIPAPVNTAPELSGCPVGTATSFTTTPSCNDAQDGARLATCNPPAGSNFQAGITSVTCSCTDSTGLSSNCMFNVFATVNTAPELSGCPVGTVTSFTTTPSCNDAQDGARVVTCNPPAGSNFQAGITTSVTCSCTDSAGSPSNCVFNVFAPKITCPVSPLVFNVDPDEQDTTVNIDSVVTCEGGTLTCGTQSKFPVGSHTVACFCFSGSTNDMCSVTIEIKDQCLTLPCDGDANCTPNEGLVKCTCTDGFYGDGTTDGTGCTECSRNVPDEKFGSNCSLPCTCASNAECDSVTGVCSGDECDVSMQPKCDKNNLNVMILQDDMDVDEKTAFTLDCTVNLGTTDVAVTWANPVGAEVQSGIFRGELTSTLLVSNAGQEDSGTYTCIARLNKPTETVTSRNDSVNINVRDFPEIDNLSLQEKSSSSLKFTWEVKDYGNDNVTCRANYSEVENSNEMSQSCEETSCELSNLSPNTDYIISVVCNNTAGPSNTLSMTSTTSSTVPEEVPDLNDADVNSTFITVTLMPVSTENGPISCYEFVVAERSEVRTDPDKDFPFSSVKENSDGGTPYRAVVMNHDKYTAQKAVIIGAEGNQESTCELPGNSKRKRASELVSSQTLTARNDPLESAKNYSIFLRIYLLSTNGEYCYESSSYQSFKTKSDNSTEMPQSPMTGLVVALTVIVFIIIILVLSIAVVVIFRRKSSQTDSAKTQSNKADVNYENEGLSRSTVYVNEQQSSNADALSYEPVQKQASGGIQLDQLPRTLPNSKVESSYDYEVTGLPKQNTALPEPPVSQDLDKVIYEDMPDELNYSHALYNQEKAPVPFKVSELPEYIHQRRLGGRNALAMEFMTLPQGQLEPWTEAVKKQNVYKGRNPDVLPYDSSRVRLVFDSINHSDYYNASFVMDQHNRHSFIAAESPSEDTADAFLWMIWQEKVDIVVMVSEMTDSAEQTCSPYWPMKEGTSRHDRKMSVALKGIKNYPDYSVRELLIMKKGEYSISVTQFHYHSWPYRRVAEHPTSLLDFIKDVKLCLKRKHFPLLVHCSDGAGATGTFIGLFCLLDELTQSSEISIYHFVQKMRKTRINMVGTKAQYVFMYEVLLLAYQTPVTVYSAHDFKKLVINKRKLSGQFQSLLKPKYQIDAQSGSATENKNRNRFSKIIPLDVSSPHLQCTSLLGGSGYINACFANSHFKKNAFILTQSPLPTTVEDFWRMVYDQKSTKIIMLNMLDSTDKTCNLYWPSGGNCQYGSVLVECTGTVTQDLYVCREMVVKHQDDEQVSVKLKHFQLLSWPEGKTAINVIRFIEAVGFSEGPEPVVVHCIDGVGHSGVYVTIHNEMQRFKDSDKVDIFQTVQSLRERNPHVFSTLKDFLFCYEALQAFVNKVA